MKIRIIWNGLLHVALVRKDSNKSSRVARVHTLDNQPVAVLTEKNKGEFIDDIRNKSYKLDPMSRVLVGV